MTEHPIPSTFEAFRAGWRLSQRTKNPYLRLPNGDVYVVFPSRSGGWTSSVGQSFTNLVYPDAESAIEGLYDLVTSISAGRLAALHAGEGNGHQLPAPHIGNGQGNGHSHGNGYGNGQGARLPATRSPIPTRPVSDREPVRNRDPQPETLGRWAREDVELRVERRSFQGHSYLALAIYKYGPKGCWLDKLISIRAREAPEVAEVIAAEYPRWPSLPGPGPGYRGNRN